MYLLDTNVISEIRKKEQANKGIVRFFKAAVQGDNDLYLSVPSFIAIARRPPARTNRTLTLPRQYGFAGALRLGKPAREIFAG